MSVLKVEKDDATCAATDHEKNFAGNDWADGYLTETFGVNALQI